MIKEYNQVKALEHQLIEIEINIAEIEDEISECEESGEHYNEKIEAKRRRHINNLRAKRRVLKRKYEIVDNQINDYHNKYGG